MGEGEGEGRWTGHCRRKKNVVSGKRGNETRRQKSTKVRVQLHTGAQTKTPKPRYTKRKILTHGARIERHIHTQYMHRYTQKKDACTGYRYINKQRTSKHQAHLYRVRYNQGRQTSKVTETKADRWQTANGFGRSAVMDPPSARHGKWVAHVKGSEKLLLFGFVHFV